MSGAYIGVSGQTALIPRRHAVIAGIENKMGALTDEIEPDGPAAQPGLLPSDVVIKLDAVDINGVDDLIRVLDRDRINARSKWMCCGWAGCGPSTSTRSSASRSPGRGRSRKCCRLSAAQ
jgi:hypothetical protein